MMELFHDFVDLLMHRPQRKLKIESSRMELDQTTVPVYQRVLDEISRLEHLVKHVNEKKN